jgi:hypothetical protein
MSGTSKVPLQQHRLCYVSTLTSTNLKPQNDLDIQTYMQNRSSFYGGFSISHVSIKNNFYNVTSKQTTLVFRYNNQDAVINVPSGYYFLDNLITKILDGIKSLPIYTTSLVPNIIYDVSQNDGLDVFLETVNFEIYPSQEDSKSTLSWVLGFEELSFSRIGASTLLNGRRFASDYNKLERHSVLYLHSLALKQNTSFSGNGKTSNFIQTIHNSEDYGGSATFDAVEAATEPQFIFDSIRDLTLIDFSLRDSYGDLLETPTNNMHVVFRLYY